MGTQILHGADALSAGTPPSQTAPWLLHRRLYHLSAVATPAVTPSLAAKTGTAPPMSRRIEALGPGLRYEVMAEVPSGGSYVVVAQEQEWNKIQP